jgi:hypothetical protein
MNPKENQGLQTEHSYRVIASAEVTDSNGNLAKIMKITVPIWDTFNWTGEWSKESNLWTTKEKEKLKINHQ